MIINTGVEEITTKLWFLVLLVKFTGLNHRGLDLHAPLQLDPANSIIEKRSSQNAMLRWGIVTAKQELMLKFLLYRVFTMYVSEHRER